MFLLVFFFFLFVLLFSVQLMLSHSKYSLCCSCLITVWLVGAVMLWWSQTGLTVKDSDTRDGR